MWFWKFNIKRYSYQIDSGKKATALSKTNFAMLFYYEKILYRMLFNILKGSSYSLTPDHYVEVLLEMYTLHLTQSQKA